MNITDYQMAEINKRQHHEINRLTNITDYQISEFNKR